MAKPLIFSWLPYLSALQPTLIGSTLDWNYTTVPQKYAYLGFKDNRESFPRGKTFGGSSAINSMNYYRENEDYFKLWSNMTGVDNWHFQHVLPYFLKSENNLDEMVVALSPNYHRRGGLLSVSTADVDPIMRHYMIAANLSGSPPTFTDGRQPFGSTIMQKTIKNGIRQSSSVAFLESRTQPNRHSIGHSMVTTILFDSQKRAIGVQFYRNSKYYKVRARKEVIVSAGSVGSPKLLLNSGIGPKYDLKDLNIEVISDLPVGQRSVQSLSFSFQFDIKDQSLVEKPIENDYNYKRYFIEGSGPLTYKLSAVTCFQEISFPGYPGLSNGCILPRVMYLGTDIDQMVENRILKAEWRQYFEPYLNRTYLSFEPLIRRSRSVGTIRLKTSNPFDSPLIDPCLLCDQRDLDDLTATTKLALKIYLSPYMTKYIEPYTKPIPGCNPCSDDFFCDSYIQCVIKTNTDQV